GTEGDGVRDVRGGGGEGLGRAGAWMRQQEFPFESRIALPEGVQPLPVRRAPERSPEPPRTADFQPPAPEPLFPRIFGVSEPNGAACDVDLLQQQEFPEAEAEVPDQAPTVTS